VVRHTAAKPNLLFIMTDHQRADSLRMVQAGVEVTPNLNRLASQGAVFSRAYNASPVCIPARTALATGKYPTKNGIVFHDQRGERAGDHKPLHQFLAEAGYEIGQIGAEETKVTPGLAERLRFSLQIDGADHARYLVERGIDATPAEGVAAFQQEVLEHRLDGPKRQTYSNTRAAVWPHPQEHFLDNYYSRHAVEFLQRRRTGPFALFVCLYAPHPPLRVPEPFASRFAPQSIALPANVGVPADGEPPGRRRGVPAQLAEGVSLQEWRDVWAAHLGLVNLADAAIGRILLALEATGQAEDTITVFTSDHGDHLGQHRMYQKMEMYEQAVKVPLIIRAPGVGARTFDGPVSHLDLMPTLLECAGLQTPGDLDGRSLLESMVSGTPLPERPVFCQYSGSLAVGDIRRAVITRRYKYVYDPSDLPELYDLESDPLEMGNAAADAAHAEVVRRLHEEGGRWASTHGDWVGFGPVRRPS